MNRILEDFKAMGAAAVGVGVQYATIETEIKIVVGILSIIYLVLRIIKAIKDWEKKDTDI